jgi:hypothetical protein
MRTGKGKRISEGRRGLVAILFSGFMLLALVFSISLASTRPETSGQQRPAVIGASVETPVEATAAEPVRPALIWTGTSGEDITQRRLPGHSECDLQLD